MIRKKTKHAFTFRHVLLAMQMLSLFIPVLPGPAPQPLAVITYWLAVFTTPLLLIICGYRYLDGKKDWSWEVFPLVAETIFFILYVGSMIYGIWFTDGNVVLYTSLLITYVVIAVICALGYYTYCLRVKFSAIKAISK